MTLAGRYIQVAALLVVTAALIACSAEEQATPTAGPATATRTTGGPAPTTGPAAEVTPSAPASPGPADSPAVPPPTVETATSSPHPFTSTPPSLPPIDRSSIPPVPETTPPARGILLPEDDSPHKYYTEWWYYTGHLTDEAGKEYGFQFVVFQVRPFEDLPIYISHFALTHPDRGFFYDQRVTLRQQLPVGEGFLFSLDDGWSLAGHDGEDRFTAETPDVGIDVELRPLKPPVKHGETGLLDFEQAGWTYYYTRTRMAVEGTLRTGGEPFAVTGTAWFDHQWGDFDPMFGDGGWDWFSVQFEDNTELMAVVLTSAAGEVVGGFGTYVEEDGDPVHLQADEFTRTAAGEWRSPVTGVTYPSGWDIEAPRLGLKLHYEPVRPDQELDARATTGNIYWEGFVRVTGTKGGAPISGKGYVELTGYERRSG